MQKLKQAIADQDVLSASLIVASKFSNNMTEQNYLSRVESLSDTVQQQLDPTLKGEARFRQFVQLFYTHLAFSGNENDFFASKYSLLNEVIDYRTGIPVTLSILFCHIARRQGFEVYGVNFPGHFLIRYQVSSERVLFIDPLNGNLLSWQELENLYFAVLGEVDEEEMPEEALAPAQTEETVVRLLHNLKASFIREEKYQHALSTVELLVHLNPEDPYERRDRGYLLHQLECPQVALADYQYFIQRCPQDPAAQLLKLQLRKLTSNKTLILH